MLNFLNIAARSNYFKRMFEAEMMESTSNIMRVTEFEDVVVKGMSDYIYTCITDALPECAVELFRMAHLYLHPNLEHECVLHIIKNLEPDSAGQILVLANVYKKPRLSERVKDFIRM